MLTTDQINSNKERYIKLIESIQRPDCDIQSLITKLNNSDFFTGPASTQYHNSFVGGLCSHCLNVYDNLKKLIDMKYPRFISDDNGETCEVDNYKAPYTEDTIKIVALLHDLSKMNFYEVAERNVKNDNGAWTKVPYIKVKEVEDRFLYGNHEQTSVYMISRFIPLTLEEEVAILHHHAGMSNDCAQDNISAIFNKYPLAALLHLADMVATYLDERI